MRKVQTAALTAASLLVFSGYYSLGDALDLLPGPGTGAHAGGAPPGGAGPRVPPTRNGCWSAARPTSSSTAWATFCTASAAPARPATADGPTISPAA